MSLLSNHTNFINESATQVFGERVQHAGSYPYSQPLVLRLHLLTACDAVYGAIFNHATSRLDMADGSTIKHYLVEGEVLSDFRY